MNKMVLSLIALAIAAVGIWLGIQSRTPSEVVAPVETPMEEPAPAEDAADAEPAEDVAPDTQDAVEEGCKCRGNRGRKRNRGGRIRPRRCHHGRARCC